MADVSRDRGQLILVTGLMVAVAMVALVVLLNTAIYTENLASRGVDGDGREAAEFRSVVAEGIGSVVSAENEAEYDTWGAVNSSVETGVEGIDDLAARRYATAGAAVTINQSTLETHEGRLVKQSNDSREFTNESGAAADWTLATGVDDVRAFNLTVDDGGLESTEAPDARTDGAFHVELDGGTDWEAFVYENTSSGDIAVATATGGTPKQECSTPDTTASVDLTRGTLNGEACEGLVWAEDIAGSYDLTYVNGDKANGTYRFVVNGTSTSTNNLNEDPSSAEPYVVPAVYSATVDVSYESATLSFHVNVRVAPGEPP